jgi:hypothetical protein
LAKTTGFATAATVSPTSSPKKRSESALGNRFRTQFKKGKLPGKDAGVDANYDKEKEGMFDLEILYPKNAFDVGAKFVPLYIKVVQYRNGKIEPVFCYNNEYFTKAFTELVENQKVNGEYPDTELPYLNAAIREIGVVPTRSMKFDDKNEQGCKSGKFYMTHLMTFVKCAESVADTLDRIKGFAEWMMVQLSTSAEEDGKVYYPFENLFASCATRGVLGWWSDKEKENTRNLGYSVGTYQAMDEFFMDDFIKSAVPFCLALGPDAKNESLSTWPADAKGIGWKKYQY